MVNIERDNKINKLQAEVFNQLNDIMRAIDPAPQKIRNKDNITQVSVEDALKELLELGVEV
jgi:hypothetical protein